MNYRIKSLSFAAFIILLLAMAGYSFGADPDRFYGDCAIYGGTNTAIQPNILLILDTSQSMDTSVTGIVAYSSSQTYSQTGSCRTSMGTGLIDPTDGSLCVTRSVYRQYPLNADLGVAYIPALNFVTSPSATSTLNSTNTCTGGSGRNLWSELTGTTGKTTVPNKFVLLSNGTCSYFGTGSCTSSSTRICPNETILSGNYVNWLSSGTGTTSSRIEVARNVLSTIIDATPNVRFGLMRHDGTYANSGTVRNACMFAKSTVPGFSNFIPYIGDMTSEFTSTVDTSITLTQKKLLSATVQGMASNDNTPLASCMLEAMRYFQGAHSAYSKLAGGGTYSNPSAGYSCRRNYIIYLTDADNQNWHDTYVGDSGDGGVKEKILCSDGNTTVKSLSQAGPICDYTGDFGGMTNTTTSIDKIFGSYSSPNYSHLMDDVAGYLYSTGIRTTTYNADKVVTYTILFNSDTGAGGTAAAAKALLQATATAGGGQFYSATSFTTLLSAFQKAVTAIQTDNTSFVAPVVPVSPENRTYLGSRVYMGFFKPESTGFWEGNLKKYSVVVDNSGVTNIVDANGVYATWVDENGNRVDDRDNTNMATADPGSSNGSIRSSALSYWTSPTTTEGGIVTNGGIGEKLKNRPMTLSTVLSAPTGSVRNIYTHLDCNTTVHDLTVATGSYRNDFSVNNASVATACTITAGTLGLPSTIISGSTLTDTKKLINFVHGFNTYNGTAKRPWLMGDVLHSKPIVVSYASFTLGRESLCSSATGSYNKSRIFVGTNDGMLHSFRDCDGSEEWAFIPPKVLPYLQYQMDSNGDHSYFVDGSVATYVYDKNKDGAIDAAGGDKVILVVGLRRGGGTNTGAQGFYYALDVSDPVTPTWLWELSPSTLTNLGEAWSDPKIIRMKADLGTGVESIVAMAIGGGYDNCHEDARFGAVQNFPGTACQTALNTVDGGLLSGSPISSSSSVPNTSSSFKGKAIFVVKIGKVTSTPSFDLTNSGTLIKSFTTDYSVPSDIFAMDTNGEGYIDRLYVGDTGGNLYRIKVDDTNPNNWALTKIFSSNPGYSLGVADSDAGGRKIFYRPGGFKDVQGNIRLYFGTGDREHPLNRAVIDRMYEVIDKGDTGHSYPVDESKLIDVTTDNIQTATNQTDLDTAIGLIAQADNRTNTTYYGWYIRLDGQDRSPTVAYPGEKVLGTATLYQGQALYTTYSPLISESASTNPCVGGNLGQSTLYDVDFDNGMAVMNYDKTNDSDYSSFTFNPFANPPGSNFKLARTDRKGPLGDGIPSPPVPSGDKLIIGCGGGICTTSSGGRSAPPVLPIYWRMK